MLLAASPVEHYSYIGLLQPWAVMESLFECFPGFGK